MNAPGLRLAAAIGIAAALCALAGGFVFGAFVGDPASGAQPRADLRVANIAPRHLAATLQVLGSRDHWGRYRPPAETAPTAAAPARPASDGTSVEREFLLVGIEGVPPALTALLLPRGGSATANQVMTSKGGGDIIRLRLGDTLIEGVAVTGVNRTSVSFQTDDGTATLHLYGNTL